MIQNDEAPSAPSDTRAGDCVKCGTSYSSRVEWVQHLLLHIERTVPVVVLNRDDVEKYGKNTHDQSKMSDDGEADVPASEEVETKLNNSFTSHADSNNVSPKKDGDRRGSVSGDDDSMSICSSSDAPKIVVKAEVHAPDAEPPAQEANGRRSSESSQGKDQSGAEDDEECKSSEGSKSPAKPTTPSLPFAITVRKSEDLMAQTNYNLIQKRLQELYSRCKGKTTLDSPLKAGAGDRRTGAIDAADRTPAKKVTSDVHSDTTPLGYVNNSQEVLDSTPKLSECGTENSDDSDNLEPEVNTEINSFLKDLDLSQMPYQRDEGGNSMHEMSLHISSQDCDWSGDVDEPAKNQNPEPADSVLATPKKTGPKPKISDYFTVTRKSDLKEKSVKTTPPVDVSSALDVKPVTAARQEEPARSVQRGNGGRASFEGVLDDNDEEYSSGLGCKGQKTAALQRHEEDDIFKRKPAAPNAANYGRNTVNRSQWDRYASQHAQQNPNSSEFKPVLTERCDTSQKSASYQLLKPVLTDTSGRLRNPTPNIEADGGTVDGSFDSANAGRRRPGVFSSQSCVKNQQRPVESGNSYKNQLNQVTIERNHPVQEQSFVTAKARRNHNEQNQNLPKSVDVVKNQLRMQKHNEQRCQEFVADQPNCGNSSTAGGSSSGLQGHPQPREAPGSLTEQNAKSVVRHPPSRPQSAMSASIINQLKRSMSSQSSQKQSQPPTASDDESQQNKQQKQPSAGDPRRQQIRPQSSMAFETGRNKRNQNQSFKYSSMIADLQNQLDPPQSIRLYKKTQESNVTAGFSNLSQDSSNGGSPPRASAFSRFPRNSGVSVTVTQSRQEQQLSQRQSPPPTASDDELQQNQQPSARDPRRQQIRPQSSMAFDTGRNKQNQIQSVKYSSITVDSQNQLDSPQSVRLYKKTQESNVTAGFSNLRQDSSSGGSPPPASAFSRFPRNSDVSVTATQSRQEQQLGQRQSQPPTASDDEPQRNPQPSARDPRRQQIRPQSSMAIDTGRNKQNQIQSVKYSSITVDSQNQLDSPQSVRLNKKTQESNMTAGFSNLSQDSSNGGSPPRASAFSRFPRNSDVSETATESRKEQQFQKTQVDRGMTGGEIRGANPVRRKPAKNRGMAVEVGQFSADSRGLSVDESRRSDFYLDDQGAAVDRCEASQNSQSTPVIPLGDQQGVVKKPGNPLKDTDNGGNLAYTQSDDARRYGNPNVSKSNDTVDMSAMSQQDIGNLTREIANLSSMKNRALSDQEINNLIASVMQSHGTASNPVTAERSSLSDAYDAKSTCNDQNDAKLRNPPSQQNNPQTMNQSSLRESLECFEDNVKALPTTVSAYRPQAAVPASNKHDPESFANFLNFLYCCSQLVHPVASVTGSSNFAAIADSDSSMTEIEIPKLPPFHETFPSMRNSKVKNERLMPSQESLRADSDEAKPRKVSRINPVFKPPVENQQYQVAATGTRQPNCGFIQRPNKVPKDWEERRMWRRVEMRRKKISLKLSKRSSNITKTFKRETVSSPMLVDTDSGDSFEIKRKPKQADLEINQNFMDVFPTELSPPKLLTPVAVTASSPGTPGKSYTTLEPLSVSYEDSNPDSSRYQSHPYPNQEDFPNGDFQQKDMFRCALCPRSFVTAAELEAHAAAEGHIICSRSEACASLSFDSQTALAHHQAMVHQSPVQTTAVQRLAAQVERLPQTFSTYPPQATQPYGGPAPYALPQQSYNGPKLGSQVVLTPMTPAVAAPPQPPPNLPNLPGIQVTKRPAPPPADPSPNKMNRGDDGLPSIRLPDSITLVKSQPAPPPQNAVADMLATRGITMVASGSRAGAAPAGSAQPVTPAKRLPNVPSAISIVPSRPQPAPQSQRFAVPPAPRGRHVTNLGTVDLTRDDQNGRRGGPPGRPNPNSPRRFSCTICDKVYPTGESLQAHMAVHGSNKPGRYMCDICRVVYTNEAKLQHHKKTVHAVRGPTETEMVIPVCDINQPGVKEKLLQCGIRHVVKIQNVRNASDTASFGLPIIPIDLARNEAYSRLDDLGASNVLSLGPLQNIFR